MTASNHEKLPIDIDIDRHNVIVDVHHHHRTNRPCACPLNTGKHAYQARLRLSNWRARRLPRVYTATAFTGMHAYMYTYRHTMPYMRTCEQVLVNQMNFMNE